MQILDSRPGLKKRSMCILVGKSGYATFPTYEEHIMPKNLTASLKMGYLRHNIVSLTRTNIEKFLLRDIRARLKEGNMQFYEGTLEFYINGNLELKLDYKLSSWDFIYLPEFSTFLAGIIYVLSNLTGLCDFYFEALGDSYVFGKHVNYVYNGSRYFNIIISYKDSKEDSRSMPFRIFMHIWLSYLSYKKQLHCNNWCTKGLELRGQNGLYVGFEAEDHEFKFYKFLPDGSVLHDNLYIPLITSQEIIEYLT